jgi:hypothetical protein
MAHMVFYERDVIGAEQEVKVNPVRVRLLGMALAAAPCALPAYAETVDCTPVTVLPAVIAQPGVFCLKGNLTTNIAAGSAITISANNVSLDLNGWKLGGQAAGSATNAVGISSSAINATVRNGVVRGFRAGIVLLGSGALVQDIIADGNTEVGINIASGGIVKHSQIVNTGGSTRVADASASGIVVSGRGAFVEGNVVSGLSPAGAGAATGILVDSAGNDSAVRANHVTGLTSAGNRHFGINVLGSGVLAVGNTIAVWDTCIRYAFASGIFALNTVSTCDDANYSFPLGVVAGQGNSPAQ